MRWNRLWNPPSKSAEWDRCWTGAFLLCPVERKQRIACASAWAMGPELFVLDEPSSNLDGEGIRQLREILKQLKKAGKTVLMAEHRLWYAADLADRVFYLRSGQLEREYNGKRFPHSARGGTPLHGTAEHCGGTGVLA